jgi:hypothetical protein
MGSNLFQCLFTYRARPGVMPEENFLTEAWGYLLSSNPSLCQQFISWCLEGSIGAGEIDQEPVVETQVAYENPAGGGCVYPDLRIRFHLVDGRGGELIFEHKWRSPANVDQLRCYSALPGYGILRRIVFISSEEGQCEGARAWTDRRLLWRDLHDWLGEEGVSESAGQSLVEFREFLRLQGLVPREVASLDAQINEKYGQMMSLKLAEHRFGWEWLPKRLRKCRRLLGPRKRQVGIDFGDEAGPIFFAGYFLTGCDQPVEMCNAKGGIDLVLVFFRKPGKDLKWQTVNAMETRLRDFDRILAVRSGKQTRNSWIVLSVRRSLAQVAPDMRRDEAELMATYEILHSWCRCIFADRAVEEEMGHVWPVGL